MASSTIIFAKRAASPSLLNRLLNCNNRNNILRSASATRSFNTNAAQVSHYDDFSDRDVDRRSDRSASRRREPDFFSVFDPFAPTRSLSQMLNLMDQLTENPFLTPARGMGVGSRRSWDVKENEDALFLRMDMPGLGKDDVKLSMEQDTLTIRGEVKNGEGEEGEESGRRFSSRIDLPQKLFKVDQIRAEMKNGVLKVVVPKVKEEEKKNVFQINVE